MPAIHETAYPRIRLNMTEKELIHIYMPNEEEKEFVREHTYKSTTRLGFLVLLKVFRRLGYFPQINEIPSRVINHIASHAGLQGRVNKIHKYDSGGSRGNHKDLIRSYFGITAYSKGGKKVMIDAMMEASQSKNIIADIINASIEELVRKKFELPSFNTLERAAYKARLEMNNFFYNQIVNSLTNNQIDLMNSLLGKPGEGRSLWYRLKKEPLQPTTKNMREFAKHMLWLRELDKNNTRFYFIPEIKVHHFAEEAKTLNLTGITDTREKKKYALIAALIFKQAAKATDDFADMFARRLQSVHNRGREALNEYRIRHQDETDKLIHTLEEIVSIWKSDNTDEERIEAVDSVISNKADDLLKQCRTHMIFSENNYHPFLPKLYKSQRKNYFDFIETLRPKSSNTDKSLEKAIEFIISKRNKRAKKISIVKEKKKKDDTIEITPIINLSWIPDKWWRTVTGTARKNSKIQKVNRIFFEICLFSVVREELKSGDLYIESSDKYGNFNNQFVTWKEFDEEIVPFLKQTGLPTNIDRIAPKLKSDLTTTVLDTDASFPSNESASIKNDELIIRQIPKTKDPENLELINRLLTERMPKLNLIDILSDTEHWINWTAGFRPISGYDSRIDSPQEKYIKTAFCYGCNLGPTQTERSINGINRKQIAYLNKRHIDENKLQQAIVKTINEYNKFSLPKVWGHGKSASADGTKWDMYQRNLLSEYHIRYGGWGGIGYYHVSDTYIALFSHFIPCGVYEAIYILDGLLKNTSDIQPDTLHADTHGQSAVVFGLAYLLGIKLMPRIKKWKKLKFFLPQKMTLENIESIFTDTINWDLIETHMKDMLRVALSISKGRIAPSTILRKLGTKSKKNKLFFAFRELGRVVRTKFLLEYLADEELRKTVRAATINTEEWNAFLSWIAFGGDGVIAENVRDEQRKIIKYNHLVANLTILHNVQEMTKIFNELKYEGHEITDEILSCFAPYRNGHLNRFGLIELRFDQIPEPLMNDIEFDIYTDN